MGVSCEDYVVSHHVFVNTLDAFDETGETFGVDFTANDAATVEDCCAEKN